MEADWKKVEELTLALMYLTTFEQEGAFRSWKGYDWEVLRRLHEKGWISNPVNNAKSVALSDEARELSRRLFETHLSRA